MNLKLDTIHKLKIFLWILGIAIGIVELIMIRQYLVELNTINLINIIGVILSVILPFFFGYYYNEYHNQKTAIEDLHNIIVKLWKSAKEMESKANDENFFKEIKIFNSNIFFEAKCFQKEISILYIMVFYFNNLKWYDHQLYNLPTNFKEKISELCEFTLQIDDTIFKYNSISIEEIMYHGVLPYNFKYQNTTPILKEFFKFLINNSNKNYSEYNEIFLELTKIPLNVEDYYI